MTENELKDKILDLGLKIQNLQYEKEKLEKELINVSDSFEKRFATWIDSDMGEHSRWILREKEYPVLAKYFEDRDLERHKTYKLLDYFEDEIYLFLHPEENKYNFDLEKYKEIFKEMMDKNIKSFTCDW